MKAPLTDREAYYVARVGASLEVRPRRTIVDEFPVRYRALGRDHVAVVPFPRTIAISRLP